MPRFIIIRKQFQFNSLYSGLLHLFAVCIRVGVIHAVIIFVLPHNSPDLGCLYSDKAYIHIQNAFSRRSIIGNAFHYEICIRFGFRFPRHRHRTIFHIPIAFQITVAFRISAGISLHRQIAVGPPSAHMIFGRRIPFRDGTHICLHPVSCQPGNSVIKHHSCRKLLENIGTSLTYCCSEETVLRAGYQNPFFQILIIPVLLQRYLHAVHTGFRHYIPFLIDVFSVHAVVIPVFKDIFSDMSLSLPHKAQAQAVKGTVITLILRKLLSPFRSRKNRGYIPHTLRVIRIVPQIVIVFPLQGVIMRIEY